MTMNQLRAIEMAISDAITLLTALDTEDCEELERLRLARKMVRSERLRYKPQPSPLTGSNSLPGDAVADCGGER